MTPLVCRFCQSSLTETFADLGMSPLSNSFVPLEKARGVEHFFPLHAYVCSKCKLVQLEQFETPEHIFSDYLYFSSFSDSWLRHAQAYSEKMIARFQLNSSSHVVEIASNDGYLLQYFVKANVPVLGVEPAANVAKVALEKGVPTEVAFFGVATATRLAKEGKSADLIAANNVLAHVPDINDFVGGFKVLLKKGGVITIEFPHLLELMEQNQFDTIYHEHFSYLSLFFAQQLFARHGLTIFDVEELPTHGGSLRIYGRHTDDLSKPVSAAVTTLASRERAAGLEGTEAYQKFAQQVVQTKRDVLSFLIDAGRAGKRVVGYGAPAKGNTLLNYCGVRSDMIEFTVDRSPHKQNMLLPGVRIPILHPDAIARARPDYVFILPWNLKDEIVEQMSVVRSWGGKFVVPIPRILVF